MTKIIFFFVIVAFGVSLGCISNAPKELKFAQSFDRGFQICTLRFFDSSWIIKKILNIGVEKELKYHLKIIDSFVNDVINKRKKYFDDKTDDSSNTTGFNNDILSMFLKEDSNITEKELRDITMNFIIAGRDTTGMTRHPYRNCCCCISTTNQKVFYDK